jgi:hypothetical protein
MRLAAFTKSKSPGDSRTSGDDRRSEGRPPRIEAGADGGGGCRSDAGTAMRWVMRRGMVSGAGGVVGGPAGSLGGRTEREAGGR